MLNNGLGGKNETKDSQYLKGKSFINLKVKRFFDLFISFMLLPIIIPTIIIIAILIRLDSAGPIIYKSSRIGKNQKEFVCYKLRTMFQNSDEIFSKCIYENEELKKQWEKYNKLKSFDPRITKIGKIIRKFSLDELPQVFNVLKGDMSIVGPRPYLPREITNMMGFEEIFYLYPGITGFWQVNGRNDVEFAERLNLDLWYIRNWSLWLDFKILLCTIKVVLRGKGAY